MARFFFMGLLGLFLFPGISQAVEHDKLLVHPLSVLPFAGLLLCIALLPLFAGHFWHSNARKLLVSLGFSAPILGYLYYLQNQGQPGFHRLEESLIEFVQFIALLGSLYTISGGIVLEGDLRPSAAVNSGILLLGAVLANVIGTTGASMLLIRPFLRINARRTSKRHLPVFFIFIVSNLGGLLTPLGDPPLFLGFLRGVDFDWTFCLWRHWLVGVGSVLAIFFVWDRITLARDPHREEENVPGIGTPRVVGLHNFVFLAGVIVVILLNSKDLAAKIGVPVFEFPWGVLAVGVLSLLSYIFTSRHLRQKNQFSWGAIIEVAVLFIGIFITMVPALALLETDGQKLGLVEPWQFFWITGALSSFLDNAPTYLTFATVAADGQKTFAGLMTAKPLILEAISVGAVFMGANTYIGNGPNFMVKAIADEAGYPTPSFFGYMLYSGFILLPVFGLITYLFFMP